MGPKPKPAGDKSGAKAEKKSEKPKNEKKPATAPAAAGGSSAAGSSGAAAPKAAKAPAAAAAKPAAAKGAAKPAASKSATAASAKVSAKPGPGKSAPAAKGAAKGAAPAGKSAKKGAAATAKGAAAGKGKPAAKGASKPAAAGKKPVVKTVKKVDKPKRGVDPKSQKGGKVVKVQTPVKKALKIKMKAAVDPVVKCVEELIAKDFVVIFSKTRCPACKLAKDIFKELKEKFTAIELDKRHDGDAIMNVLCKMTGARTVPRVFVDGECIGGGSDVQRMYRTGELEELLYEDCED
ncbi:transcriptional regulatory protein AlgP isoform X4 [Nilaparvata lugens]|uniref:transcriptional regulatory protein AlgP isoform X4 n=1 Tax=Nilaparvata lugens TaxID=108931 RepID=UPI00193D5DDC|nr:transcriptional regulatory protein AlgP isoform X4 [Nilaparvata lugens]